MKTMLASTHFLPLNMHELSRFIAKVLGLGVQCVAIALVKVCEGGECLRIRLAELLEAMS